MYYKEIIKADQIQAYQDYHKIIYRALSSMIFDLSFVENGYSLCQRYKNINSDDISRAIIFRDMFSLLILKTYKAFCDNSGTDSTDLFQFKNKVVSTFVKSEYRDSVLEDIKLCQISDRSYKTKLENIKNNVIKLRDTVLAHNLNSTGGNYSVFLPDIRELLEKGCELFQALSFQPLDFYSLLEGDGYDFSREFAYTKKSTEHIWDYFYLSSKYITKLHCDINTEQAYEKAELANAEIKDLIRNINKSKQEEK